MWWLEYGRKGPDPVSLIVAEANSAFGKGGGWQEGQRWA